MIEREDFSPTNHIEAIDVAIQGLMRFQDRTATPALLPHQYIGTVVDNTTALLTAPANSLDKGGRHITFSESSNWTSLMQAVHRSFFSSVHLATERGLADICESYHLSVQSSYAEQALAELDTISKKSIDLEVQSSVGKLRGLFERSRPSFDDYLNLVLKSTCLPKKDQTIWRKFFAGLTIVRNKASHSDSTLSDTEKSKLVEGGLKAMVSSSGQVVVNPRMYPQVTSFILDFFDLVTRKI